MLNFRELKSLSALTIVIALTLLLSSFAQPALAGPNQADQYEAVAGLIGLRSTFSDGAHSIEELAQKASSRGIEVLCINDYDRIAFSYGIPPFRNILRHKRRFPSIMSNGPKKYVDEIKRVSSKYPDMVIIPGCTTSPYYYWTGSLISKNRRVHKYDYKLLIVNLDRTDDYGLIPNLHNRLSLKYTKQLLPGLILFIVPLLSGLILLMWRGFSRVLGFVLIILSVLAIVDYNPFRSSLFTPYKGDQGVGPFQEVIDYVNYRGGLCFWNDPDQRAGFKRYGSITVNTSPHVQILHSSDNYTGFAAPYRSDSTIADPGKEWDRVLNEYCRGERERPSWAISMADLLEDGHLAQDLGAYRTTFLVNAFSKAGVLEAMEKGRMYCSRRVSGGRPKLDYFNVLGEQGEKASMGETLRTSNFPLIKFRVSNNGDNPIMMTVTLIRGGTLLQTFIGETPLEIEYTDEDVPDGEKIYYRLMDSEKDLTSNPIFVVYGQNPW